ADRHRARRSRHQRQLPAHRHLAEHTRRLARDRASFQPPGEGSIAMATIATATPHTTRPGHAIRTAKPGLFIPSFSLWQREIVRFYRQRARVVGVIASPLLFWVAFGAGFSHSFSSGNTGASGHAFGYFFPGSIVLIVLFTAIFSMMSLIQDRNEGFLLTVIA